METRGELPLQARDGKLASMADGPAVLAQLASLPAEAKAALMEGLQIWASLVAMSGQAGNPSTLNGQTKTPIEALRSQLDSILGSSLKGSASVAERTSSDVAKDPASIQSRVLEAVLSRAMAPTEALNKSEAQTDLKLPTTQAQTKQGVTIRGVAGLAQAVVRDVQGQAQRGINPAGGQDSAAARPGPRMSREQLLEVSIKGWLSLAAARQAFNAHTGRGNNDPLAWLDGVFAEEALDAQNANSEIETEEEDRGKDRNKGEQEHQPDQGDETSGDRECNSAA